MENLNRKRLLILGGSLWKNAIRKAAEEFGITLVAAGKDTSAGIFEISAEGYEIDSTDSESLIKLIKENNINGVYMGGSETVIGSVCSVLNSIGMPCYCTHEQWDYLQNKSNFKELCIKNGLPVVPQFSLDSVKDSDFPVITKPVDGSGSRGFSVCRNRQELSEGYKSAEEVSPTNSVMIEKYVKNDSVVVFYTVSNGEIIFSGLEDKYPVRYRGTGSYVGGLFVFESSLTDKFRTKYESAIQKMISSIGIKEGSFWMEVFTDSDNFYFNEVGYRYGGSASLYPINYLYGINQVSMDIYYALTGKSYKGDFVSLFPENTPRKKYYAVYPVYAQEGKIIDIAGVAETEKNPDILEFLTVKGKGSIVTTGTFAQVVALVHMVFDSLNELKEHIALIHEKFRIYDENGQNLAVKILDTDTLTLKNQ